MTLYSVLGVREDATESSIKAAYRTAAKANHPDTNPHATPGLFAQIAEAYDVLGDKAKRVSYDYTLSLERSTVDTMQKSEWSGFETYTNKASGAKDNYTMNEIALIVKIQANFRGLIARKKVR